MILHTILVLSRIIFYILSYDLWFYISHRILHYKFLFNTIHYIHHEQHYSEMTYKSTYVAHFLENIFQSLGTFIPIAFIQFDPYEFLIVILFTNIRGMLRHDFNSIWLIGDHHILHHKYLYCNYGDYYLDYLFNTHYKKNMFK